MGVLLNFGPGCCRRPGPLRVVAACGWPARRFPSAFASSVPSGARGALHIAGGADRPAPSFRAGPPPASILRGGPALSRAVAAAAEDGIIFGHPRRIRRAAGARRLQHRRPEPAGQHVLAGLPAAPEVAAGALAGVGQVIEAGLGLARDGVEAALKRLAEQDRRSLHQETIYALERFAGERDPGEGQERES